MVIDWLCDQIRNRDIAVAGLYCDYLAQEQQSTTNILGAILKQLLERDGILKPLREFFREEKKGFGGRAVQLRDLVEILKTTIASLPEVFICIDGLDECVPNNRRELLESLRDIVRDSPTTRVFLSGRPHIRDEVERYFMGAILIAAIPTIRDIERYLEMKLDRDPTPSAMDDNLRAEIMRVIPRNISQMCVETTTLATPGPTRYPLITEYRFLLVSLNINAVLEEVTIHQRKKKLDEMIQGNGLRSAYSATLARIKAQNGSRSRLGMEVLMWLSHSEGPLDADELCHAMGVEIGSTDLNSQNIPSIETLLGCSLGLVIVEASSYTVRLVHYTLQEYLSNNTELFHRPHSMIADVCLTYLNFQSVRNLLSTRDWIESPAPLLKYASCSWGAHAGREITESTNTLALRLLDGFDKHVSSTILASYSSHNWDMAFVQYSPMGFTGLHYAAYLGIPEIVVGLLEMKKWDLGATDMEGNTAISWAAKRGHGDIVKMLLEQEDVATNAVDIYGWTPLSWAAIRGYGYIVKMLLEWKNITPDTADNGGRTPLLWAAEIGHGDIVKMLLKREDVTPNTTDKDGRTPLWWAAVTGREDIVKTLLEREDVTPDTADKYGRTPLSWATEKRYEGIVKILLEQKDIMPDAAAKDGGTALSWAAECRPSRTMEILLQPCNINQDMVMRDLTSHTALTHTSEKHYAGVLKRPLETQRPIPRPVGNNSSIDLFPARPPEPSQRPSKRTRGS